ncbi:MAG: hypothetical protein M1834_001572 [Cirrosporium novae-zelandiae]|nr:MAG: hypothetical protein M1834_004089 [Cirrosporium novae-zelandiae]KAI9735557.1 MAG: hypothetical protein M1834_001572 [Cirrosporium novae-zelandiae]
MQSARQRQSSWSRTGCATCKRRRKKCDEGKPTCHNCQRLKLQCEGYDLLWTNPIISKPHSIQRNAHSRRDSSSYSISTQDLNTVEFLDPPNNSKDETRTQHGDMIFWMPGSHGAPDEGVGSSRPQTLTSSAMISGLSRTFSHTVFPSLPEFSPMHHPTIVPEAPSDSIYFIQYHVERLCPALVMMDSPSNPLRTLLVQAAFSSPMLLNALCAVSACHMSMQLSTSHSNTRRSAITFYAQALTKLNRSLSMYSQNRVTNLAGRNVSDEIVLTSAILCKYEIVKGSTHQWRQHLSGLERLIQLQGGDSSHNSQTKAFLRSFTTYHRNIAGVTDIRNDAISDCIAPEDYSLKLERNNPPTLDSYMGLSEDLLKIIARIYNIFHKGYNHKSEAGELIGELKEIDETLNAWDCSSGAYAVPQGVSVTSLKRLEMVANTYRYAAYIYLHFVLGRLAYNALDYAKYYSSTLIPNIRFGCSKEDAISHCLETIRGIPEGDYCESALVLPLFLAGCETTDLTQFKVVVKRLLVLEQNIGIGNIGKAREVVQRVWESSATFSQRKDWFEVLRELGWDLIVT